MDLGRRDFFKYSLGSMFLLSSAISSASQTASNFSDLKLNNKVFKKLSYLAYKSTSIEGEWDLSRIDGQIPNDINGRFLKIGPGTKDLFGNSFNHFFDGDAYISEFHVSMGKVTLKASFLNTSERKQEQAAGKMLFHEFGTRSPEKNNKGRKNQPNINLIPWSQSLLALSEGGHPVEVDTDNLNVKSIYNFKGSLPAKVSFTAHPKFDSETKEGFAFGIYQGLSKALKVFKMDPVTEELIELYSLKQKHVFMIHDMLITKNFIIFVIPPAFYKITDILRDKKPMSQTLKFDRFEKTRILVLSKDGSSVPLEYTLPPRLVFHNGNAHEENGIITFQTFMTDDESLLNLINQWQLNAEIKIDAPSMYEVKIDLNKNRLESTECLLRAHDFPVLNDKFVGRKNQFIYCASMGNAHDPMAFDALTKFDLFNRSKMIYSMKENEMCGEPFFVAKSRSRDEDEGYLAYIGYNQNLDQSFLEILDAADMKFLARIWANCYLPLGFHGHFISN